MKFRFLIPIILFLLIPLVYSKSYYYDSVTFNLNFYENGSVIIYQTRDYHFDGSFSYAYIDFQKTGANDIDIINIIDLDDGKPVPYTIQEDSTHVKVDWNYDAYNENKKFQIVYSIDGVVKRYEDVSEFYWKLIEEEHEKIKHLQVDANLPKSSSNLLKVFVHSQGRDGKLQFLDDNSTARFTLEDIPRNTFVEMRMLTESSVFSQVATISKPMYEKILKEEEKNYEENKPNEIVSSTLTILKIISYIVYFGVPVVVLIYFYFKYGREPKVSYEGIYEHEPPMNIPPMALASLLDNSTPNIQISAKALLATLFDFAVRGFLVIKEEKKKVFLFETTVHKFELTKKGQNPKIREKLTDFEWKIFSLFFKEISEDGKSVDTEEIKKWTQKNYTFRKRLLNFSKTAKKWFEKKYFKIYEKKSEKARKKFLMFLLIFSIVGFFLGGFVVFMFYFPIAFVSYLFSGTISRRTSESTLQVKKWKSFKKMIEDFSDMENAPTTLLHIWDRYLVYAVVLGVAEELLKNLKDFAIRTNQNVYGVGWYYGSSGVMYGTLSPKQFSILSSNISSTINSMTMSSGAFSTSTSTGGGFSGGGGGGGGGGGSGAG